MIRTRTLEVFEVLQRIDDDPEVAALYRQALARLSLSTVDYTTALELCRLTSFTSLAAHTLLICMFMALQEGSACLPLSAATLKRRLEQFLEGDVDARVAAILAAVQAQAGAELVGAGAADFKPLIRQTGRDGGEYLYFQRHHAQARRLAELLRERLADARPVAAADAPQWRAVLTEVCETAPVRRREMRVQLNPAQRLAVALGLRQNFTLIAGGPGTGKTAILSSLARCLIRLGLRADQIVLTAPTGRAAQRMTESLRRDLQSLAQPTVAEQALRAIQGVTLHRLLEFSRGHNRFRRHRFNPVAAQAILVDEVSMVDVRLLAGLLDAAPADCRLVLIGDPEQLPPVDVGEVLADLLVDAPPPDFSPVLREFLLAVCGADAPARLATAVTPLTDRVVRLDHNYRAVPVLIDLAQAVRAGAAAAVEGWQPPAETLEMLFAQAAPGGTWLRAGQPGTPSWPAVVDAWLEQKYFAAPATAPGSYFDCIDRLQRKSSAEWLADGGALELQAVFAALDGGRILTAVRHGPYGSNNINQYMVRRIQLRRGRRRSDEEFAGLPILVVENDREAGLYNGDVGVLLSDGQGVRQGLFRDAGGFRMVAAALLPAWRPAFAMTIHKSQGSEFEQVLTVLPTAVDHGLLRRDLLYTALTRARQSAVLFATEPALRAALAQAPERIGGMALWPPVDVDADGAAGVIQA